MGAVRCFMDIIVLFSSLSWCCFADFIQDESVVVVASLSWTLDKYCPCVPGEVVFLLLWGLSLWFVTEANDGLLWEKKRYIYSTISCVSTVFFLYLCSRIPSVTTAVDVKTYAPIRCYQGSELLLLLWAGEVQGPGLGQLLKHQDFCSERMELSDWQLHIA